MRLSLVYCTHPLTGLLILPQLADLALVSLVPGILFEIAIGLWLLVKGVELRGATSLPAA